MAALGISRWCGNGGRRCCRATEWSSRAAVMSLVWCGDGGRRGDVAVRCGSGGQRQRGSCLISPSAVVSESVVVAECRTESVNELRKGKTYSYIHKQMANIIILYHSGVASAVVRWSVFNSQVLGSIPSFPRTALFFPYFPYLPNAGPTPIFPIYQMLGQLQCWATPWADHRCSTTSVNEPRYINK
jgi:hypothetical protein